EYFSEDPVVTGRCGGAVVRGVQKHGFSACPKHFACNSQETNRTFADSVLSERALREIYLLGFEICVTTSKPKNIMTSYNRINGVWGHYNYELVTAILRNEWGYDGCVMTDWWMRSAVSPEFPTVKDQAYRVRAGVNVLMPGGRRAGYYRKRPDGTLFKNAGKKDGITRAEIQANAKTVLAAALEKK
ncbi:MAG: beta-glucosidase, partial [Clostridia bacterium]|nr:beta-glucosidase [Clostridia bacterium]